MPNSSNFVPLPNSEHRGARAEKLAAAFVAQPLAATEQMLIIEIDLILRRRPDGPPFPDLTAMGGQLPRDRKYMTHEEFEAAYGADPADVEVVRNFAREFGLTHVNSDLATRIVTLSGTIAAISRALNVDVAYFSEGPRRYRAYRGPIYVPASLDKIVLYVLGIDDYVAPYPMAKTVNPAEWALLDLITQIHTPRQVADVYNFPKATGKGECIGMLEFGGGYDPQRVHAYFAWQGMETPAIVDVPVAGGANRPGWIPYLDAEVYLDIEVAGAAAPDAKLAVYFAPCNARGFVQGFAAAIHDRVNRPSVVFCTWGFAETKWAVVPYGMNAVDDVIQDAALLGITVSVASGDFGATAGIYDGEPHLYFPASSPHVLSVGGTTLYSFAGSRVAEYTWNRVSTSGGASTGGFSDYFPLPEYQQLPNVKQAQAQIVPWRQPNEDPTPGRAVPDVSALGDPTTGYLILMDHGFSLTAGTSAATPLWCALIARINELLGGRIGYINPLLYKSLGEEPAFRDILLGNNLYYKAGPGWDACTGWGSPDGTRLLEALNPQSDPAKSSVAQA